MGGMIWVRPQLINKCISRCPKSDYIANVHWHACRTIRNSLQIIQHIATAVAFALCYMNTQLDNKLLKLCDLVPCICVGSSLLQALAAVLHKCHHMGDRAAKLRKLNAFRRKLPHCSASALGAILKEIKQHGVPEGATSRDAFRDARDLQNQTKTPFVK